MNMISTTEKIALIENEFVSRGLQTQQNLVDLRTTFHMANDDRYLKMLIGFVTIYKNKGRL